MDSSQHRSACSIPIWVQLWRLSQGLVALLLLYSLLAHLINHSFIARPINYAYYLLFNKNIAQIVSGKGILPQVFQVNPQTIGCPDILGETACGYFRGVIVCYLTVVVVAIVLNYICGTEWVQENVSVKNCWDEVEWYNPWDWFVATVCTITEVTKWVLKQICKVKEIIYLASFVICIIELVPLVLGP